MTGCTIESDLDPHAAHARAVFFYDQLFVDPSTKFLDMGDNAHQSVSLRKGGEHAHRLFQRIPVQRAEAFVNKERIQPHTARAGLNLVR